MRYVVLVAMLSACGGEPVYVAPQGCSKDSDCKGERVCVKGACADVARPSPDASSVDLGSAPVVDMDTAAPDLVTASTGDMAHCTPGPNGCGCSGMPCCWNAQVGSCGGVVGDSSDVSVSCYFDRDLPESGLCEACGHAGEPCCLQPWDRKPYPMHGCQSGLTCYENPFYGVNGQPLRFTCR